MNTMFLPICEKVNAFHNLLLMNSGIVLPQELFFQKKCIFQESVYWLNRQQSTQQLSKLIANFNQSFIYYYEFMLYFLFLLQYLLGWLVLLLNPIPDGKMISLNKGQKSFRCLLIDQKNSSATHIYIDIYFDAVFCYFYTVRE